MTLTLNPPELMTRLTGDEKHSAAATSTLDVLEVLYDGILNVHPDRLDDPDRDRFYLSKGHGPMAYYAVLAVHGFFPVEWLDSFGTFASRSATIRIATWFPEWRSPPAPWVTVFRWRWEQRWPYERSAAAPG